MYTWHWQTWNELPYLTCSLLEKWPHGFFTHHCWPRSPAELVASLQPQAEVYRVKQVHGNTVLTTNQIGDISDFPVSEPESVAYPEADGLVTEQSQQAVWVASADCTPVLIADRQTGLVGAVHSGWRGTAAKIVPQAIGRMLEQGCRLENLLLAMGPAIAGEVYQVSEDVAEAVCASVVAGSNSDKLGSLLDQFSDVGVLDDPEPGKVRLDVRRVIGLQLEQLGVAPEQVAIAPYCTYQTPEHFFSYRRDNLRKVQWSGIVSRELA
ncbi:peptidoglycan editing factor PgeF [Ancylothrix sp. C2]|uniref:peptidoglycan editing factor PgeF n=1 Tax=Ancylothrix sp. D3o TaxID=2953691 RepID=UPI0021BA4CE1|nr:peptidoglycan editing factor PgeF [Ancylothrix sp. D3o]MCT7949643.1 peptidoglycan editing factor PgeF [Ancylothrix sp. D3o]